MKTLTTNSFCGLEIDCVYISIADGHQSGFTTLKKMPPWISEICHPLFKLCLRKYMWMFVMVQLCLPLVLWFSVSFYVHASTTGAASQPCRRPIPRCGCANGGLASTVVGGTHT